ncbi:DUF6089 family protein [Robiginitalea sp. M366]|uniref:type IX secretion system protein PorG n=1 Tax=Robiginitalea aestuariiviva TaxID=3036903 RepID=UPI00240CF3A1|nr:DUF6089 family protein [Robiginitalea aestuariiviva]MDG1570941.1 DUF6089 family protein [Robiginitalea aestuariiviva]
MRILCSALFLLLFNALQGQTYELGLFGGGANNIGDIGRMTYVAPSGPAFGAVFKWNRSKRYAWRAHMMYGTFTADDQKSDLPSRQQRGLRMENRILEFSGGLEFNFVEYNLHQLGTAFTPYLYTGVTYFRYDFDYFDAGFQQQTNQRDGAFAIPMVAGAKYRLNQFLILGAEVGARYTFTDNLDASNPEGTNYEPFSDGPFGNVFSDDWYVFSGVTLTFTFGRKPCCDAFE